MVSARHLLAADPVEASQVLATAFADDPMVTWLAGGASPTDAERATRGFFGPGLQAGLARGHTYGAAGGDGLEAVAVWSPPDVPIFDEVSGEGFGVAFGGVFGDEALGRLGALAEITGDHHPTEPHFYLFLLGAATQGRGAGPRVVEPVLRRCDAEGLPCYLESSNPRNVGFYERLGFAATWEGVPDTGGPLLTGMWRPPIG